METITDTTILDNIVDQLKDNGGKAYATYDEGDILIYASVIWIGHEVRNVIDGFLEGVYFEVDGFKDLQVDAWLKDEPVNVDIKYIETNLNQFINF